MSKAWVVLLPFSLVMAPIVCQAKGVATAPLVMAGVLEDMRKEGDKITFLFTGKISRSRWAVGDWELTASVRKLPITVDQTFFYKTDDPVWGFRFEQEETRALECFERAQTLSVTIPHPTVHFNQGAIQRVDGDFGQIEGCGE